MSIFKSFRNQVLTKFGDIKIYPYPMMLLYDPGSYRVRGEDAREVINLVKPGDILLRGYVRYLDGYVIPGYFSHVGLYLGRVSNEDLHLVEDKEKRREKFRTGDQMVMHSMAEGVFMEDLLGFCRCDYMAILRFPPSVERDPEAIPPPPALKFQKREWLDQEKKISERLDGGETIHFSEAFPVIREKALRCLGRPYDFGLDFTDYDQLCCTEFVYLCTKSLYSFLQVKPEPGKVLIFRGKAIKPDAFLKTNLQPVWCSESASKEIKARVANHAKQYAQSASPPPHEKTM